MIFQSLSDTISSNIFQINSNGEFISYELYLLINCIYSVISSLQFKHWKGSVNSLEINSKKYLTINCKYISNYNNDVQFSFLTKNHS